MKKSLLASLALLVGVAAAPAMAADLPVKATAPTVTPPVQLYDWTGFYIGGHFGYGWGDSRWTFLHDSFWNIAQGETIDIGPDGWLGGGQIGFNYQVGHWLFGIEGTLSGANIAKTVASPFFPQFGDTERTKIKSLYTVAARIGVVWDQFLFYGKGGWAGGQVELSAAAPATPFQGSAAWTRSRSRSGWLAGAGVEYMLVPNVILGVEYNYIDLGGNTYSALNSGPGAAGLLPANTVVKDKTQIHTIVGRVSYRFDWARR